MQKDDLVYAGHMLDMAQKAREKVAGRSRDAAFGDEKPTGPLMIQGDHGPVAYRNVRLQPRGK